jgi:hypothetical protein
MNTKNPLKIPLVTVCAAFVGLATWQGFQMTQPPAAIAAPAAANCETPGVSHDDTGGHTKAPEPQAAAYMPRDFASVFPDLENAPQDWRKFKPAELTMAPIPNASFTFKMTEYKEENGRVSWTGRNEDMPLASFVFSANAGAWAGVMLLPDGSEFTMHSLPDGFVAVHKTTASSLPCPVGEAAGHPEFHVAGASIATADAGSVLAQTAAGQPTEPELDTPDANGFYYSSLLIVVDKPFVDALGLPVTATQAQIEAQVDATCAAYTASMNTILQNSRVDNLRWSLAGTVIIPEALFSQYTIGKVLDELLNYPFGVTSEEVIGAARKAASKFAADQIFFIAIEGAGGLAFMSVDGSYFRPYAGGGYNVITGAHELGHNFGLRHDRVTDNIPDNDGEYYYGHEFHVSATARPDSIINNLERWEHLGTVMSYFNANKLLFFSNPDIYSNHDDIYDHAVIYSSGSSRLGVPNGEARAADAARWLREKAQFMASFRKPLAFLYHPEASVSLPADATLTLSARATVGRTDLGNEDTISYQWYFNNMPITTGVAGGTLPVLTMRNVSAANTGTYNLVATSLGGVSVWSTAAIVTVTNLPPTISAHPQSVSVAKGGTLTLSAVASGANLTFQWKHNGVVIAGANGPSYTKTSVTEADAGTYTLTVSNESDSITSQPATVTVSVTPAPLPITITTQPKSVFVAKGGTLTLSAVVTGDNLTFQWKHHGTVIAGANGSSYTKTGVTEADAGTYTLTVSDVVGSITSQPATVTVVTSEPNSGGGGGGGGAPSHWFFAALLIFFTIKLGRQNHP